MLESSSTIAFILIFFILYMPVRYGVRAFLRKYKDRDNCLTRQCYKKQKNFELKGFLFRVLLEGCFGLGLTAFICVFNSNAWGFKTGTMSFAEFFAVIQIILLTLAPIYIIFKAYKVYKRADGPIDEEFKLFKNLREKRISSIAYHVVFLLRRMT